MTNDGNVINQSWNHYTFLIIKTTSDQLQLCNQTMPWYFPWSESIKKRACRYLLQHYLGDFLKEKLDLDQLSVDLYNGKGTIKNVPLDVWVSVIII